MPINWILGHKPQQDKGIFDLKIVQSKEGNHLIDNTSL